MWFVAVFRRDPKRYSRKSVTRAGVLSAKRSLREAYPPSGFICSYHPLFGLETNPVRFEPHCIVTPGPRRFAGLAELPGTQGGVGRRRPGGKGKRPPHHLSRHSEAHYVQSRSRRTCSSSSTSSRRSCATGWRTPFRAVFMARAIWLRLLPIRAR